MQRILTEGQLRTLSREELYRFQDEKFAAYVRTLLTRCSPFHSRIFREAGINPEEVDGIDSWRRLKLPLLRKDTYRAAPEEFVLGALHGRDDAVKAYQGHVDAVGPMPRAIPIRSFPNLDVEQLVPTLFTQEDLLPDNKSFHTIFNPSGVFLSGGSTGVPIPVRHSRLDRTFFELSTKRLHAALVDELYEAGVPVRGATLYPQAPHMGFWMTTWGLDPVVERYVGLSGAGMLPTERLAELFLLHGVNVFAGIPSYVRNRFVPVLAEMAREKNKALPEHFAIALGGEAVTDKCRSDVEAMLRSAGARSVRVVGGYGASESRFSLWQECRGGQGYHAASPDLAATRIVHMNGRGEWDFLPDGEEGLVVQFPLEGTGTVLMGFILGDTGVLTHEPCPGCGMAGPRLLHVGRLGDVETQLAVMGTVEKKIRGATVNLQDLHVQLGELPGVTETQLVIRPRDSGDPDSPDELLVRVAPSSGSDGHGLAAKVHQATKALSEVTPVVEVVTIEELLGNELKFKPIVDLRHRRRS